MVAVVFFRISTSVYKKTTHFSSKHRAMELKEIMNTSSVWSFGNLLELRSTISPPSVRWTSRSGSRRSAGGTG